jgi:putative hydrolase of HD superfamily
MELSINNLLQFVDFTHKFQQLRRQIFATGEERNENDAEHSFQLALCGWYIVCAKGLNWSLELIMKYALAHDLVEVYAGDTYFHTTDKSLRDTKKEREINALGRIKAEFPEFHELHQIIEEYEERKNPEARLIYALDKLLPVINIYLDNGRSWHRDHVTYSMARTKDEKIAVSPEIMDLWQQLIPLLEAKMNELFPPEF